MSKSLFSSIPSHYLTGAHPENIHLFSDTAVISINKSSICFINYSKTTCLF